MELKNLYMKIMNNKYLYDEDENYRPISILTSFSKVFEKNIFDQMREFFENKVSKFLCGFRKGFST